MDDLNSVTLVGRLTRDPELRSTSGGTSLCSLRLAFNTSKKGANGYEDVSNYVGVTVWGSQGESCANHLAKGRQIAVKGRLQYREWEGESGKRSAIDIVADRVQFLGSNDQGGSTRSGSTQSQSQATPTPAEDDVPF